MVLVYGEMKAAVLDWQLLRLLHSTMASLLQFLLPLPFLGIVMEIPEDLQLPQILNSLVSSPLESSPGLITSLTDHIFCRIRAVYSGCVLWPPCSCFLCWRILYAKLSVVKWTLKLTTPSLKTNLENLPRTSDCSFLIDHSRFLWIYTLFPLDTPFLWPADHLKHGIGTLMIFSGTILNLLSQSLHY